MPLYEHIKLGFVSKEVIQIEEDTQKIIAEYKSMLDASHITGIDMSGIAKMCRGEQYTARGLMVILVQVLIML